MKKSVSRIDFFFFSCLVVFFSDVRVCDRRTVISRNCFNGILIWKGYVNLT